MSGSVATVPTVRPRKKPGPKTPLGWKDRYLTLLRSQGGYFISARQVGVAPKTAYREREADPAFNDACEEARQEYADSIEHRMVASAEASGNPAGFIVRLKALRPAEYIEKHAVLSLTANLNELPVEDATALLKAMLSNTTQETQKSLAPTNTPHPQIIDAPADDGKPDQIINGQPYVNVCSGRLRPNPGAPKKARSEQRKASKTRAREQRSAVNVR